jgi:hypothetical protein
MVKSLKYLILGIAIGGFAFGILPVTAAVEKYVLTKVPYKIIVNGAEYKDDTQPALNLNGNTYVPLRNLGKLIGKEPKWNSEKKQVEIGEVTGIDLSVWVDIPTAFEKYNLLISSGDTIQFRKGSIKNESIYTLTRPDKTLTTEQKIYDAEKDKYFSCIVYNGRLCYFKISELKDAGLID